MGQAWPEGLEKEGLDWKSVYAFRDIVKYSSAYHSTMK